MSRQEKGTRAALAAITHPPRPSPLAAPHPLRTSTIPVPDSAQWVSEVSAGRRVGTSLLDASPLTCVPLRPTPGAGVDDTPSQLLSWAVGTWRGRQTAVGARQGVQLSVSPPHHRRRFKGPPRLCQPLRDVGQRLSPGRACLAWGQPPGSVRRAEEGGATLARHFSFLAKTGTCRQGRHQRARSPELSGALGSATAGPGGRGRDTRGVRQARVREGEAHSSCSRLLWGAATTTHPAWWPSWQRPARPPPPPRV